MKRKKYITPTLTVVTFKAEQGFAISGGTETKFLDLSFFESTEVYNDQAQQNWQEESGSLFSWSW